MSKINAYNMKYQIPDDPMNVTHIYVTQARKPGGSNRYRCSGTSIEYGNAMSVFCTESKAASIVQKTGIKIQIAH